MMTHARLFLFLIPVFIVLAACGSGSGSSGRESGDDDSIAIDDDPASDDSQADDSEPDDSSPADDSASDDDLADDTDDDADDDTCATPFDGMEITHDTVICPSDEPYYLSDATLGGIIHVTGSNLTLTGDGVQLIGDGEGAAIALDSNSPQSHVTIKGFRITSYYEGISGFGEYTDLVLENLTIEESYDSHINIRPAAWSVNGNRQISIQNSQFLNSNVTGVICDSCYDSAILNNHSESHVADSNESNFILIGGAGNLIDGNTVVTSGEIGCNAIWLLLSNDNIIQNNDLNLDYKDGSHLHGSSGNIFRYNTIGLAYSAHFLIDLEDDNTGKAAAERLLPGRSFVRSSGSPVPSENNQIYANEFHNGILMDVNGIDSVFCVGDVGNDYLDGAVYQGPDPDGGTCP